jgi:subtilisin family serine protease
MSRKSIVSWRGLALALAALVPAACTDSPEPVGPDGQVPLPAVSTAAGKVIPGRFIVTLREGTDAAAVVREHGLKPDFVYAHAFKGFAGAMSDAARQGLLRDGRVQMVEPDGIATIVSTETNATWGLDRVDQRSLPLSTTYTYNSTGSGVTAYIIDTGIRFGHTEFGGRATTGFDAVDGGSADDCHGHGTHVAGTVGGSTYGVAKDVSLVAVRVLDCNGSGSWSGVIAGIDYVTGNHTSGTPAVANLSLGGGANTSVDNAVRNMIADGVATAIAAGNGNFAGIAQDACKSTPARVAEAMTVGATDNTDRKTSWSNYGNCVDWFAPGLNITSAWNTNNTATNTISGTSMASPHTAGVAALYLQGHAGATALQVRDALYANTTKGIVTRSKTTNNHLLFTNY